MSGAPATELHEFYVSFLGSLTELFLAQIPRILPTNITPFTQKVEIFTTSAY